MDYFVIMVQFYVILSKFAAFVFSNDKVLQMEIVTLGLISNSTSSSLHYTSGAFDYGVRTLRKKYGNTINITHTYLLDERITNCIELTAHAEYMLAEWYYLKKLKSDISVFLSTCKTETFRVNLYVFYRCDVGLNLKTMKYFFVITFPACADAGLVNKLCAGWNILMLTS